MTYNKSWPELPYDKFVSTGHLLHMATQIIGKLKLITPFEAEWANVPLWITSQGLTSGLIPYKSDAFSIDLDLINHSVLVKTSWGKNSELTLSSMSVAQLYKEIFDALHKTGVDIKINPMPQEIPNPVDFEKDTEQRSYNPALANAWWRILLSSYQVLDRYHVKFIGKTSPIGFMWGTFDLRDVRNKVGAFVPTTGVNAEYIRRNAMDEEQIEAGWWSGNPAYPRAAFYSFTYPQPKDIETFIISPTKAHWDDKLNLFVLDYDDVRQSENPENDLLTFLDSTYEAGAKLANWDPKLIGTGKPL